MRKLFFTLALFAGLVPPLAAQDLTDEQFEDAFAFARHNSAFVLYHEFGHLLISQFELPILGKEEDAADNIATVILLGEEADEFDQILIDSSYGWYLSDVSNTDDFEESDFYDSHSLDIQRSYQIVCLMVGQSLETFGEMAEEYGLDEDRIESCSFDYEQLERNWLRLNETFIDPVRGDGYTAEIFYEAPSEDSELAAEILQDSGMLEEIQARFAKVLPKETKIRAKDCGVENAFYDPELEEIVMCYELVDLFLNLIIEDLLLEEDDT